MLHIRYTSWWTLGFLIGAIIGFIWPLMPADVSYGIPVKITPPKAVLGAQDPCGLVDVVCPDEVATKTITATIYSYQAVAGQTDGSPCTGAMAGVDFCDPPYPIVANNCLKLGSKVTILGITYTVADRMAKKYGCNDFDRLIPGNVTLYNHPIGVLLSDN